MKRNIDNKTLLDTFTEDFCNIVDKHCKYIICSGFVAIAHGRSRGTEDIDMIIEKISNLEFEKLHKDLISHDFICIQSDNPKVIFDTYLSKDISVRYVKKGDGYFPPEMEVKFAKDDLDEEQINARVQLPLTGLDIYFSTIESNIAFKEEYLKSEKDIEDARHLRIIYKEKINEDEIKKIKEIIISMRFKK
ncbi:hypothetical protein COU54_03375 [Candidatus Pacearchaeota archaeon CG10_big_fil_rev_8_21_14_0_10_31_24]|nr:MAG: hypothetical protein COU54_03375 [Candidatus Pacearchaeota archaeon CG10_big_fil_rev_8_21_14_0_10_31_24]